MCFWWKRLKINRLIKKIKVMQQSRLLNQPTDEALAKERAAYHCLAGIYAGLQDKKMALCSRIHVSGLSRFGHVG